MHGLKLALLTLACGCATSAMATTTPVAYSGFGTASAWSTSGGTGTSNGTAWNSSSSSAYGTNGTNYGNTYTYAPSSGSGPKVGISAWGSTTASTSSTIQKAWIGSYGSNGLGITSQSSGELNSSNVPDAASPTYQHAIDNTNSFESLLLSFSSAVTLKTLSIGFKSTYADATVLEYVGSGSPMTKLLTGESYADLLNNGWRLVGNVMNMSVGSANALSGTGITPAQYWMVGAYLPIGTNSTSFSSPDAFKISGFTASAVPEPGSIALFGIAGAAMLVGRRRKAARAA